MLYLAGSIILTSYLTLAFKVVEKYGISNLQAIVCNHIVCVVVGSMVNGAFPINTNTVDQPWFLWACAMGVIFIMLFNLVAFTVQRIGVAVTSVANKISLAIPFAFSIYLYKEPATILKITGVIVALLAVVLTCLPRKALRDGSITAAFFLLPLTLFLGSGLLDTMIKYVEQRFLNPSNNDIYLVTCFGMAALTGVILLSILFATGRQKFDRRSIIAGICIGIPNYFSIWFLLKVLKAYGNNSSAIIPVNNMGIVLFSSIMAWLLFKERLSAVNWMGILLSLAAIALIAYG